ncbi:MAG TPA: hypothetical protein VGK36_12040 [Candidatus Angelobacter sp.]|jgi:hypothetical protein
MDLSDALQKTGQILDEERINPTVAYQLSKAKVTNLGAAASLYQLANLYQYRIHPRPINDDPTEYQFKSMNFDLLCAMFERVPEHNKQVLYANMNSRICDARSFRHKYVDVVKAGSGASCSSELPLIAEFLVRMRQTDLLISALFEAAVSRGLTLLLLHIEKMIAFDFTLFTEPEYERIATAAKTIAHSVEKEKEKPKLSNTLASNTRYHVVREIPELCNAIVEECRSARYLYVKGSLLPGMNLEINQDKNTVRSFLEKLGFAPLLIQSLDEAEKLYRTAATAFELKSCLGHLRSFVEQVHLQACAGAHKKYGGSLPSKWGEALRYLIDNKILTQQEWQFFGSLYTLVSDTGVHPLIADREYARLMRNMSIECGLLLLTKMDKLGINLTAVSISATP